MEGWGKVRVGVLRNEGVGGWGCEGWGGSISLPPRLDEHQGRESKKNVGDRGWEGEL